MARNKEVRESRQPSAQPKFVALGRHSLSFLADRHGISSDTLATMRAVSAVLPFRTNSYVVDHLIDWKLVPDDPIYQMVFPQAGMLERDDLDIVLKLVKDGEPEKEMRETVARIRRRMNPHPAGQDTLNIPHLHGVRCEGIQHKYEQTVLVFPSAGQTCHTFCGYCFRWPQFIGEPELKISLRSPDVLLDYVRSHPEVTDVLLTGGDPMVMSTAVLERYIRPLLVPETENVRTIRIGTKSLAYWPYRFLTDRDADSLMRLFDDVIASGRNVSVMSHFSHPREVSTGICAVAVQRLLGTGAKIYCQAPIIRYVNDSAETWLELWRKEDALGCIPYYMFVERDTGPKSYFRTTLLEALEIFSTAYAQLPGLARVVRGPVMSTTPGKVLLDCQIPQSKPGQEPTVLLKLVQAREPWRVGEACLAMGIPGASWITDLRSPSGDTTFFGHDFSKEIWDGEEHELQCRDDSD